VVEDPAEVTALVARVPERPVLRQAGPVAEAVPVDPDVGTRDGAAREGCDQNDDEKACAHADFVG
jgi:hypothetical protein